MVWCTVVDISRLHLANIPCEITNIAGCIGSRNILQTGSSSFKALIYNLQEFSLLWIYAGSFFRVDAKERRVKLTERVILTKEVTSSRVDAAWALFVGMIPRIHLETIVWDI